MDTLSVAAVTVQVLKRYGQALPIEFLARLLGRKPSEIEPYLEALQREHVIERHNDSVELVITPSAPPSATAI